MAAPMFPTGPVPTAVTHGQRRALRAQCRHGCAAARRLTLAPPWTGRPIMTSWRAPHRATSGLFGRWRDRHAGAALAAGAAHSRQRGDRRGHRAGCAAAGLDQCAALAPRGRVPHLALSHRGQSLPQREASCTGPAARCGRASRPILRPAPDAQFEARERDRRLAAAIGALPERQRAAIVLSYQEGLSNAEVAAVLDTSVSSVETLLVRAKRALRSSLGDI